MTIAVPSWAHCGQGAAPGDPFTGCTGVTAVASGRCLTHADTAEQAAYIASLSPGAEIDLRGTTLDATLLGRVLAATKDSATQQPTLGDARFTSATFTGEPWFVSAIFTGGAHFDSATFTEQAHFGSATFKKHALFGDATFSGKAHFGSVTFAERAYFDSASRGRLLRRGQLHRGRLLRIGGLHQEGPIPLGDVRR